MIKLTAIGNSIKCAAINVRDTAYAHPTAVKIGLVVAPLAIVGAKLAYSWVTKDFSQVPDTASDVQDAGRGLGYLVEANPHMAGFDDNGDGIIDKAELPRYLDSLGCSDTETREYVDHKPEDMRWVDSKGRGINVLGHGSDGLFGTKDDTFHRICLDKPKQ